MTASTLTPVPARIPASGPKTPPDPPTLARLTSLEIRKSLTTRSGRWVAGTAPILPAGGLAVLAAFGERAGSVKELLSVMCVLVAILMLTLGVLSTAGEWTHRTVQTTFLAVPRRSRVVTAKYAGIALLALAISAIAVATTLTVAAVTAGGAFEWTGATVAVTATLAAGAAFALMGAGIGAAVANAPAALAGSYVTILLALPLLRGVQPDIFDKVDPAHAMMNLATGQHTLTATAVLTGWVVVTTTAGAIVTHRKALA